MSSTATTCSQRAERRRAAQQVMQAKLDAAYSRIRELEIKTMEQSELDPVGQEVQARLSKAQPAWTKLVEAQLRPAAMPGDLRACRNFGLHSNLGCGIGKLPKTAAEAKRWGRGGRSARSRCLPPSSNAAESDPGPGVDLFSDGSSEAAAFEPDPFLRRFQAAMAFVQCTQDCQQMEMGLAPGTWLHAEDTPEPTSTLNLDAAPFVSSSGAAEAWSVSQPSTKSSTKVDETFYEKLLAETAAEASTSNGADSVAARASMPSDNVDQVSLIKTLGDQLEDFQHSVATRHEAITAEVKHLSALLDSFSPPPRHEQVTLQVLMPKLNQMIAEITHLTEREGLQGLPQVIMDLGGQVKFLSQQLLRHGRPPSACVKAMVTTVCSVATQTTALYSDAETQTPLAQGEKMPGAADALANPAKPRWVDLGLDEDDTKSGSAGMFFSPADGVCDKSSAAVAPEYNAGLSSSMHAPSFADTESHDDNEFRSQDAACSSAEKVDCAHQTGSDKSKNIALEDQGQCKVDALIADPSGGAVSTIHNDKGMKKEVGGGVRGGHGVYDTPMAPPLGKAQEEKEDQDRGFSPWGVRGGHGVYDTPMAPPLGKAQEEKEGQDKELTQKEGQKVANDSDTQSTLDQHCAGFGSACNTGGPPLESNGCDSVHWHALASNCICRPDRALHTTIPYKEFKTHYELMSAIQRFQACQSLTQLAAANHSPTIEAQKVMSMTATLLLQPADSMVSDQVLTEVALLIEALPKGGTGYTCTATACRNLLRLVYSQDKFGSDDHSPRAKQRRKKRFNHS